MDEHEDLIARLRAMGDEPVEPTVERDHLARIATAPTRGAMRHKLRIAVAFLAGLLIGGSGLATAGALPDPAQHLAHRALEPLGIDVPDPERYHGPECGDEVKRNHGAYVRDDHDLAKSRCGKPVKAGQGGEEQDDAPAGDKGPCEGPPPWAGKGNTMTPEEKAAAKAARDELCGDVEDDETTEPDEPGDTKAVDPAEPESTTTTTVPPSSTTEPTTTTTTTTTTEDTETSTTSG